MIQTRVCPEAAESFYENNQNAQNMVEKWSKRVLLQNTGQLPVFEACIT